MLHALGAEPVQVKLPEHLAGLDRIILPGGESTTFGKLAVRFGLIEPLREFVASGRPTWGTCAGLIFLAKDVGRAQPTLGLMDIHVRRNAFGRQAESFTTQLRIEGMDGEPFLGVFIRAPVIEGVGADARALCTLEDGTIVAARQRHMLATSFHPELTRDTRVHELFLRMN